MQESEKNLLQQMWDKQEEVAMHFNDLLIQLRTRAIGGVTALIALAGGFLSKGLEGNAILVYGLTLTIIYGWAAAAFIDLFYYRYLLLGAVGSILEIEDKSEDEIRLSTWIERKARSGSKAAPILLYVLGAIPPFVFHIYSIARIGDCALMVISAILALVLVVLFCIGSYCSKPLDGPPPFKANCNNALKKA